MKKLNRPDFLEKREVTEYRYYLITWGGFYNKEFKILHNYEEGEYLFQTKEERDTYISSLKKAETQFPEAGVLCIKTAEGYHTKYLPMAHIILKNKKTGKLREIVDRILPFLELNDILYYLEYKLPIDNVIKKDEEIISSYITGAFDTTYFTRDLVSNRGE